MKLHLTQADGHQLITAYANGKISINHQTYTQSLIVLPNEIITDWQVANFDSLTAQDFDCIVGLNPEVVLLGTGQQHRFIHPRLIQACTAKNIPVECMTTDAACRTYNILMSEGRKVAAAMLLA